MFVKKTFLVQATLSRLKKHVILKEMIQMRRKIVIYISITMIIQSALTMKKIKGTNELENPRDKGICTCRYYYFCVVL